MNKCIRILYIHFQRCFWTLHEDMLNYTLIRASWHYFLSSTSASSFSWCFVCCFRQTIYDMEVILETYVGFVTCFSVEGEANGSYNYITSTIRMVTNQGNVNVSTIFYVHWYMTLK